MLLCLHRLPDFLHISAMIGDVSLCLVGRWFLPDSWRDARRIKTDTWSRDRVGLYGFFLWIHFYFMESTEMMGARIHDYFPIASHYYS